MLAAPNAPEALQMQTCTLPRQRMNTAAIRPAVRFVLTALAHLFPRGGRFRQRAAWVLAGCDAQYNNCSMLAAQDGG